MEERLWYYAIDARQYGPVSFHDLQELAANGTLHREHLVWEQGTPDWRKAEAVPGLFDAAPISSPGPQPAGSAPEQPILTSPPCQWQAARLVRRARVGLILGILGMLIAPAHFVLGILAVAFAGSAVAQMSHTRTRRGYGVAIAALVVGILAIARHAPAQPMW